MPLLLLLLAANDKLLLTEIEAKGRIDAATIAAVEETVATEAVRSSGANVVTPAAVRAALGVHERQMLTGCNDAKCFKAITSLLSADRLITTTVQRLDTAYSLTLELFDLKENRSVKRSTRQCELTSVALLQLARGQTAALFGVAARLSLWDQPPAADVFVDGRSVGRTPVGVIPLDSGGKHIITMSGPAVTTWRTEVTVEAGGEARVRAGSRAFVELETQARGRRNAGFGLIGAGVATAAAATALWIAAAGNDRSLDRLDLRRATQAEIDSVTSRTTTLTAVAIASSALTGALVGVGIWLIADNPYRRELAQNGILAW